MLTQARLKEVLKYDRKTGVFTWLKRGKGHSNRKQGVAGCLSGEYQRIRVDGVLYHAHRLAWLYVHGVWPCYVDHRRGGRNSLHNLRECTHQQNMANVKKRRDNTSGFKGVSRTSGASTWHAQIRSRHLGCFADPRDAARAYDAAAVREYGAFAKTNRSMGLL